MFGTPDRVGNLFFMSVSSSPQGSQLEFCLRPPTRMSNLRRPPPPPREKKTTFVSTADSCGRATAVVHLGNTTLLPLPNRTYCQPSLSLTLTSSQEHFWCGLHEGSSRWLARSRTDFWFSRYAAPPELKIRSLFPFGRKRLPRYMGTLPPSLKPPAAFLMSSERRYCCRVVEDEGFGKQKKSQLVSGGHHEKTDRVAGRRTCRHSTAHQHRRAAVEVLVSSGT